MRTGEGTVRKTTFGYGCHLAWVVYCILLHDYKEPSSRGIRSDLGIEEALDRDPEMNLSSTHDSERPNYLLWVPGRSVPYKQDELDYWNHSRSRGKRCYSEHVIQRNLQKRVWQRCSEENNLAIRIQKYTHSANNRKELQRQDGAANRCLGMERTRSSRTSSRIKSFINTVDLALQKIEWTLQCPQDMEVKVKRTQDKRQWKTKVSEDRTLPQEGVYRKEHSCRIDSWSD